PGREPRRTRPPAAVVLGALRATRATALGRRARAVLQGDAGNGPRAAQPQPPPAGATRGAGAQRVAAPEGDRLSRRGTGRKQIGHTKGYSPFAPTSPLPGASTRSGQLAAGVRGEVSRMPARHGAGPQASGRYPDSEFVTPLARSAVRLLDSSSGERTGTTPAPDRARREATNRQVFGTTRAGDRGRTGDLVLGKRIASGHHTISAHRTQEKLRFLGPGQRV